MKTFIATVLALGAMTLGAQASTIQQIKNASYELYRDGQAICSAQFVSPTELLTAAHCLADSDKHTYSVQVSKDNSVTVYELKPYHINPEYDTGTLKVVDENAAFPFVDVAPALVSPAVGADVILAGFPDVQGYFYVYRGVLSDVVPMPPQFMLSGEKPQYVVSTWAIPGSSGSGLYYKIADEYLLIGTLHGGPGDAMNFTSVLEGVRAVL